MRVYFWRVAGVWRMHCAPDVIAEDIPAVDQICVVFALWWRLQRDLRLGGRVWLRERLLRGAVVRILRVYFDPGRLYPLQGGLWFDSSPGLDQIRPLDSGVCFDEHVLWPEGRGEGSVFVGRDIFLRRIVMTVITAMLLYRHDMLGSGRVRLPRIWGGGLAEGRVVGERGERRRAFSADWRQWARREAVRYWSAAREFSAAVGVGREYAAAWVEGDGSHFGSAVLAAVFCARPAALRKSLGGRV